MDTDRLQDKKETPLEDDEISEMVEQTIGEEETSEAFEWDGTDSAIVPDPDAAEFEENPTGVHISYTLRREEIKSVLRISPVFRYSRRKMLIQTLLFVVLFIFFLGTYLSAQSPRPEQLIIALVCGVMVALVWVTPEIQLQALSKRQATNEDVEVEIFPDVIKLGKGEGYWEIPLDGTSSFIEKHGLLILTTPEKKCVAFPIRSIEPSLLPDVLAMLTAGTEKEDRF